MFQYVSAKFRYSRAFRNLQNSKVGDVTAPQASGRQSFQCNWHWCHLWLRHCPTALRTQFYVMERMLRQSIYSCSGTCRTPIWCFLHAFREHLCLDYAPGLAKWCNGAHFGLRTPILSHQFSKCHLLFAFFIMSLVTFFFPCENLSPIC